MKDKFTLIIPTKIQITKTINDYNDDNNNKSLDQLTHPYLVAS